MVFIALCSWLRSSKFKALNKIKSTRNKHFMAVCILLCCGKTELIIQMLLR